MKYINEPKGKKERKREERYIETNQRANPKEVETETKKRRRRRRQQRNKKERKKQGKKK